MKNFLIRWAINTIVLFIVVYLVSGISVDKWQVILVAAFVLGLLNAFIKPLILAFTLPLTVSSLGFFTLIVNGFMFYLASKIVEGFHVISFWSAFWGALLFSIINFFLNILFNPNIRIKLDTASYSTHRRPDNDVIDVEGKRIDE